MSLLPQRALILAACLIGLSNLPAQTLDSIIFGNTSSESAHGLAPAYAPVTPPSYVTAGGGVTPSNPSTTAASDVVVGGLGQTARRLLPRTPNADVYGGEVSFTMAVDPVKQNYFSLKLWGSDEASGNAWFILNVNGLEEGSRHGSSDDDPLWFQPVNWAPGQFLYRTMALPLHLTRGKTSVTLKIRSLGWISYYDSGAWFGHYSKLMTQPSPGLYRAYTHAGSIVDYTGEAQGVAPTPLTPRTLENETTTLNTIQTNVNNELASNLNGAASSLSSSDLQFMARCYDARENLGQSWIVYPSGMTAATVITKIIAGIDAQVAAQSANSAYVASQGNDSWGGYFGPMGDAIRLLWPQINVGATMTASVAYAGSYGTVTRKSGWSQALRASVDSGRLFRRTIANQTISGDGNVYMANRGLLLVDPANALNESEALRYLKEACGLLPWMGNDQAGGTPQVPVYGTAPNGPNWYMCTSKGTTKDGNGFVGSDYGEMGPVIFRLGVLANDASLKTRGIAMTRARAIFRFPGVDGNGYLNMQGAESIGVRNSGLPGHQVYLAHDDENNFFMASQGAAVIGNDLLGAYQQQVNEGQLFGEMDGIVDPYTPMEYTAIKAMAQTNVKLPMAVGAADFAWADEENMVVAAKHGEERLFANLFWRQPDAVNGFAKVLDLSGDGPRLADVQVEDVRYKATGAVAVHDGSIEQFSYLTPPENPVNALFGVKQPIALRSDFSTPPAGNRDGGRGTGYTLRYGHWLVGINSHYSATYQMVLPANFTSATDLISGTVKTGPVVLAAKTSAVFYLADGADASPVPSTPLLINAYARSNAALITWSPAAAAASYTVKRSTTSGGTYTTVATGVATLGYRDTTVVNGTTYYYVISATSAGGTSGNSVETSVTPGTLLSGSIIGTSGSYNNNANNTSVAAFDGNLATFFDGPDNAGDWVGLDLGMGLDGGQAISQIKYCPRAGYPTRMVGGVFQGANLPDFSDAVTLATVSASPAQNTLTSVAVANTSAFKYVRYLGPATGGSCDVAEVQFFPSTAATPAPAAPVSAPTGLTAGAGKASVFLSFNAVANATGYQIKRSLTSGGATTTLATTDQLWYQDLGVTNGTTYYYVVRPANSGGTGPTSAQVSATPASPSIPSAPTGLTGALSNSSGQITLNWNAAGGLVTYKVKRSTFSSGPYATLATGVSDAVYNDPSANPGTTYYYAVSAVNSTGESANSGAISVLDQTSSQQTGTVIGTAGSYQNSGTTIAKAFDGDLNTYFDGPTANGCWAGLDFGSGATKTITRISYCPRSSFASRMVGGVFQGANAADFSDAVTLATIAAAPPSGAFTSVTINNASTFRYVRYLSPNSSSGDVAELQFYAYDTPPAPPAPTGLGSTAGNAQVALNWAAGSGNSYNVKRAPTSGGSYATVASGVTATTYIDTGLANGTTYYYVVTAVNTGGESANSNQVSGTPTANPTLPSLWQGADVGTVGVSGNTAYSAGTYTLQGGGADIWGTADGFQFSYQAISGDGTIIARVASQTTGKSGLMIRESLAANSKYADLVIHKYGTNNVTKSEYRATTGGVAANVGTIANTAAPYWLKLVRTGNVFTSFNSADGVAWNPVGTATISTMAGTVYVGVVECAQSTTTLGTAAFDNVSVVSLPSPWASSDIGTVAAAGSAKLIGTTYTVTGSGGDIWNTADTFRYACQTATGDCDITARVADVPNTNVNAKAGIMIRETLNANSANAMVFLAPAGGATFQRRVATGGTSANVSVTGGVSAPYWVRLVRVGNTFTGYYSVDGSAWTSMGSTTITMAANVYIGLSVTSHADGALCPATLDNVTVNP